MTTTKRIGMQCQISTKTRSLLYPDIKPEPGGEQLPSPFHSWERGLNEHTNGLGREYFPKGTDFRATCNEDVQKVRLNTRKVPGSPTEVILK